MDKKVIVLVNAVTESSDKSPDRCKGCVFDFTDADGYHQQCYEDRWAVGGCFLIHPAGVKKFDEIAASPRRTYVATLEFDHRAQEKTMAGTGTFISFDSNPLAKALGVESGEEKEYDPWTDPAYQFNKVSWLIHRDTGYWMICEILGYRFTLYTDGDDQILRTELMRYINQQKLQFFRLVK